MAEKYFVYPFGQAGTLTAIPDPTQVSGSVSYQSGFPILYQTALGSGGYPIPRDQFNQLMNDITGALQQIQQTGFPSWISSSANDGSPYAYSIGNQVWSAGVSYVSLANANIDMPPSSKWLAISYGSTPAVSFSTGDVVATFNNVAPTGWLMMYGQTIGNASSNATFADPTAQPLFNVLWASTTNAALPMYTSGGSPIARGVSAAADWAANNQLTIPDGRGNVLAGQDNMGGVAAGRLSANTAQGIDGTILANMGGEQSHTLSTSELASHTHTSGSLATNTAGAHSHNESAGDLGQSGAGASTLIYSGPGSSHGGTGGGTILQFATDTQGLHSHSVTGSLGNAGSGSTHNNVQPTLICLYRIKL